MSPTEKRNFKRIILYFIYPFVYLLKIIPKDKNLWVFGNFKGYIDNTKYIYEFLLKENKHSLEIYWITRDKELFESLKSQQKPVLYYYSLKGIWKSFRAQVSFIANGYSDLNKIAILNSNIVHLWHGFPIKKIVFDADLEYKFYSLGVLNKFATLLSQKSLYFLNNKIDLYFVSSKLELDRMSSAFRVKKSKFVITGTPRIDIVSKIKEEQSIVAKLFSNVNTTQGKNIMYAPSWREEGWSNKQTLQNPQLLLNYLEQENSYLFIKRHPLTTKQEVESWGIQEGKRIRFIDGFDINESYKYVDILITDFSSLIFDYAVLKKPILYFITDLKEYSNNRGLYDNVVKISENKINENWGDLIKSLKMIENEANFINHPHYNYILTQKFTNVRLSIVEQVYKKTKNV